MKIENQFTVGVPVDRAWDVMLDLQRIAPCLPGASIQEQQEDGTYRGTMRVKIGPITANYRGTVSYRERDEANHRAVLEATGRDARGQGTASATITATLEEADGGTRVSVETDMRLTGRAAQFGRGVAQDVASKIFEQFAECLEREISGGGEASEAEEGGAHENTESAGASGVGNGVPVTGASTLGNVMSEDPMVMAGSSLGAVTVGSVVSDQPSGERETPVREGREERREAREAPRREPMEEPEPLDLGAASREALLKRLVPVAAGIGALAILVLILRARR